MRPLASYGESKTVIPLALPQALLERLNQLAMEQGINRSALIRAALQRVYFDRQGAPEQHAGETEHAGGHPCLSAAEERGPRDEAAGEGEGGGR